MTISRFISLLELGAVRKKIAKNWPLPLVRKMFALAQPPSSLVRADTPKISKNLKVFAPKSVDVRI